MRTYLLLLEFSLVFVVVPVLLYYRILPNLPIPFLLLAGIVAFVILRRDPAFPMGQIMSLGRIKGRLWPLLLRDAVFIAVLGAAVRHFAPEMLFSLVKRAPGLWGLIMVLYPLVSVYPQELLYRAFFFHRYQPLFGDGWAMVAMSTLAFGFAHILFGNWISVVLSLAGGLLFAITYHSSGSLLLTCIDHAIFGNFIFTIGLGQYFYHGTRT